MRLLSSPRFFYVFSIGEQSQPSANLPEELGQDYLPLFLMFRVFRYEPVKLPASVTVSVTVTE